MSRIIEALKSAVRWSRGDKTAGKSTIVHVPAKPGTRELAALHAIRVLQGKAQAETVMEEIRRTTNRDLGRGALALALDWLEDHGFVSVREASEEFERGGRKRRYFALTAKGEEALNG